MIGRRKDLTDSQLAAYSLETLAVKCSPLSVRTETSGPYTYAQWSQNAQATDSAVTIRRGTVLVTLEYRSLINNKKRFPCFVRGSGPRMSMATDSRGLFAGNSLSGFVFLFYDIRFRAQSSHF
jgi:hypothetical protein